MPEPDMRMNPIFHTLLYQVTWIATVVGWIQSLVVMGPVVAFLYLLVVMRQYSARVGLRLFGILALGGWLVETLNQALGLIRYIPGFLAPWWIAPLWGSFSFFCAFGLPWIRHYWIMSLFGAVAGPLAYLSAMTWTGQSFGYEQGIGFALEWAVLFPLSVWMCRRKENFLLF